MNDEYKRVLEENGADVTGTISRFGDNEAIYQKFLERFPNDPNYEKLESCLKEKDYENAFKCAHTLKGVTANLGLDPVCKPIAELVEELRNWETKEPDAAYVDARWNEIEESYNRFRDLINTCKNKDN